MKTESEYLTMAEFQAHLLAMESDDRPLIKDDGTPSTSVIDRDAIILGGLQASCRSWGDDE